MLTKKDLASIKEVVKSEVKESFKGEFKKAFKEEFGVAFKQEFNLAMKPIKRDINYIMKTLKVATAMFDEDLDQVKKRVDRVEDTLNLPPIN